MRLRHHALNGKQSSASNPQIIYASSKIVRHFKKSRYTKLPAFYLNCICSLHPKHPRIFFDFPVHSFPENNKENESRHQRKKSPEMSQRLLYKMIREGSWNLVPGIWLSLRLCGALAIMHSNYTVAVLLWLRQGNHSMDTSLSSFRDRKSRNEIYFNTRNPLLFIFFLSERPHEILAIYRMKEGSHSLSTINACEWVTLICASSLLCRLARTEELSFMAFWL